MKTIGEISQYVLIFLLSLISLWGMKNFLQPPYSDQQISASIVDTWELSATVTTFVLVVVALVIAFSLVIVSKSENVMNRRLALASLGLAICDGILWLLNHAELTTRTTQLTGHTFSTLFGLF